jgi:hexosaminidase
MIPQPDPFNRYLPLKTRGDQTLGERGWEIYFNHPGRNVVPGSVTGNVTIEHINGDLMRIIPAEGFLLEPGQKVSIRFSKGGWLIKEAEAPLGPYMVFKDSEGNDIWKQLHLPIIPLNLFPGWKRYSRPGEGSPCRMRNGYTRGILRNNVTGMDHSGRIIPAPAQMVTGNGKVVLGDGLMIHFHEGLKKEAGYLARMMEQVTGEGVTLMNSDTWGPDIIYLTLDDSGMTVKEGYRLTAVPESGISITGGDAAGVFYGIQSLLALIPVEYWRQPSTTGITITAVTITDQPAFPYRGMHLDIARNYNSPEVIKKLISIMAFYKMNKLHLHLTEDEGWRLEIPSFPELTEVGSNRGHTRSGKDHLIPAYGSGPVPDPEKGYGSGYLTREAFIDILRFASDHHIQVIPEINMPGHARAAIYAMEARYDRLMKEGKTEEAEKYRLMDPLDESEYNSAQNFNDNVVCVCKEAPYLFFQTVVDDILRMYEDAGLELKIMHAGGDEVPHGVWEKSPVCRDFLARTSGNRGSRWPAGVF